MGSVRESKKKASRLGILNAAKFLWAKHGYSRVSIAKIAKRANVSDRTVYNYYSSKPGILSSLIHQQVLELSESMQSGGSKPGKKPQDAIEKLFNGYDTILKSHKRKMLREFLAAAVSEPDGVGRWISNMEQVLCGQLQNIVQHYQSTGQIAKSIDLQQASIALRNVYVSRIITFVANDMVKDSDLRASTRKQVEHIFRISG